MEELIRSIAERYLGERGVRYAQIVGAAFLPERRAQLWHSLFLAHRTRHDLWQVMFERRILEPGEVDTANRFSVFVDPETNECAVFNSM